MDKEQAKLKKFVSWRRVSTKKQGASGLGLDAQEAIIKHYAEVEHGEILADFHEVYTGKHLSMCTELRKAVDFAKANGATLMVAKTDRFRNTQEALGIYDEMGGNIYFCDLPRTDRFTLTLFFALAEREAEIISIRTKAALQAAKARGKVLGNVKGADMSKAREASARSIREKATSDPKRRIIWETLMAYVRENGGKSPSSWQLSSAAESLNRMGVKTVSGFDFNAERAKSAYHNMKRYMEKV